jgi:hypothetical protein
MLSSMLRATRTALHPMSAFGFGCAAMMKSDLWQCPRSCIDGTGLCPRFSFWCHNIWVLGCLGVCAQMRKSCPRWSIGPSPCRKLQEAVRYQALAAGLGLRRAVLAPFSTCRALDRSRLQRKGRSNYVGLCWFIGLLTWLVLFRLFHTIPKS